MPDEANELSAPEPDVAALLAAIEQLVPKAKDVVQSMSSLKARWRMTIPVDRERDYDVIIWDLATVASQAATALRAALGEAEEAKARASTIAKRGYSWELVAQPAAWGWLDMEDGNERSDDAIVKITDAKGAHICSANAGWLKAVSLYPPSDDLPEEPHDNAARSILSLQRKLSEDEDRHARETAALRSQLAAAREAEAGLQQRLDASLASEAAHAATTLRLHDALTASHEAAKADRERLRERYNDLIFAVGNKHPGESRHETAKRYIVEAERGGMGTETTAEARLLAEFHAGPALDEEAARNRAALTASQRQAEGGGG